LAHIIVVPPGGDPVRFELEARVITVGRTPANHIQITDGAASRKHCMIKVTGDTFTLLDLGSANGTTVNGDRVKEHELTHGDRIKIGKTVLAFKES
jgi:pSer/pThr/pTyr-binding forkhead associated (FHA) protein